MLLKWHSTDGTFRDDTFCRHPSMSLSSESPLCPTCESVRNLLSQIINQPLLHITAPSEQQTCLWLSILSFYINRQRNRTQVYPLWYGHSNHDIFRKTKGVCGLGREVRSGGPYSKCKEIVFSRQMIILQVESPCRSPPKTLKAQQYSHRSLFVNQLQE